MRFMLSAFAQATLRRCGSLKIGLLCTLLAALAVPAKSEAQLVTGGDFDICDFCGTLRGSTAFLVGRPGFGTDRGVFVLINSATVEQDVDLDGYTPGPGNDFNNITVVSVSDFVSVSDPSKVILAENLVIANPLRPLFNGFQLQIGFYVNIPNATPAGRYKGNFTLADPTRPPTLNPNGQALRSDGVFLEIEVLPASSIGLVAANTPDELDSLVLAGRPGQTVSGVARIANLGNVDLTNVRVEATDLIATSGTGLRIRAERLSFSPGQLTRVAIGDTARVTVTARIPLGILAGRYRGELIVQGDDVEAVRIPLIVVVTTPGDIVFENNPVFGRNGDNAVIIFNADPGSPWLLRVFDMQAITTFSASGTVFAGGGTGTPTDPEFTGDEAVRYTWTLQNGRGENVAAGMYLVVIEATQAGQRRQLRGKLMVIR
jgi:hypothetical protein